MAISPVEFELIREAREALRTGAASATRTAHGLSLAELATQVNVDASTLWRWENGQNVPKGARAVRYGLVLRTLGAGNDAGR